MKLYKDDPNHYNSFAKILSTIDVLVDGPFVEELKNVRLVFKGSSNQRIIDIRNSEFEHGYKKIKKLDLLSF